MKKNLFALTAVMAGCLLVAAGTAFCADPAPAPAKTDAKAAPAKTETKAPAKAEAKTPAKPAAKAAAKASDKKGSSPDSPVAVVNGKPIKKREFDLSVTAYLRDVAQQMGGKHGAANLEPNNEIKRDVLERMIRQELLSQEIDKQPLKGVDEQAKTEFEASKSQFATEEEFKKALADEGLDEATLKDMIRRKIAFQVYVQDVVAPGIKIADEESKKFYDDNPKFFDSPENVRACHILVSVPPNATEEQKKTSREKIDGIRKKLTEGADFAALAKESSDCPSGIQGGDLGAFPKGRMVKPFEEAAFSQKVGEIGNVVETQFGYHVIRVDEHNQPSKVPFETAKERIVKYLQTQKVQKVMEAKAEELRKTAKVDIVSSHM